jgi:hypothetical protein
MCKWALRRHEGEPFGRAREMHFLKLGAAGRTIPKESLRRTTMKKDEQDT